MIYGRVFRTKVTFWLWHQNFARKKCAKMLMKLTRTCMDCQIVFALWVDRKASNVENCSMFHINKFLLYIAKQEQGQFDQAAIIDNYLKGKRSGDS
jgi:hypothetical protein